MFVLVPEGGVSDHPTGSRRSVPGPRSSPCGRLPDAPLAIAGSQELYLGKRMATWSWAPTSARVLLGEAWPATAPEEGSREELELANALTDRLAELFALAVIPVLHAERSTYRVDLEAVPRSDLVAPRPSEIEAAR